MDSPNATARHRASTRRGRQQDRKKPLVAIRPTEAASLLNACTALRPGRTAELSAMRLRIAMVILNRTGVRVSEMLDLLESDLIRDDGTIVIRRGKGAKRRLVGMDAWGWRELDDWLQVRNDEIPTGHLIPIVSGRTAGARWHDCDVRRQLSATARRVGLRHTAHPHAFRHGHAVDARREGIDLEAISAQLGHADLSVTQIYLQSVDPTERLRPLIKRPAPMIEVPHARRPQH